MMSLKGRTEQQNKSVIQSRIFGRGTIFATYCFT